MLIPTIIIAVIAFLAGIVATWATQRGNIARLRDTAEQFTRKEESYRTQAELLARLTAEKEMLQERGRELSLSLANDKHILEEKELEIRRQMQAVTALQAANESLNEKLEMHKDEIKGMREQLYNEFQVLAGRILDENSRKLALANEERVGSILNPLKEKIQAFEKKVEDTYNAETREKTSLREELKQMVAINHQMSEDARNLTRALKGDSKAQGNWGEVQLELLLSKAGLQENIHYIKQCSFKAEDGALSRPDFVINLPEEKNFIVDSKVSLTAYERYYNAEEEPLKVKYLAEHLSSLHSHINDLSSKNYQNLYGINTPDYVFLFVPVEPAFTLAVQSDLSLFDKALGKNIILVGPSTLLASMRTVSFIWKQENQRRNVLEIAKESGALYDKFVGFVEDLQKIEKGIQDTERAYSAAMNKLTQSSKRGDTIVGRIERIKKLGANSTKSLPPNVLDKAGEDDTISEG